MRVGIVGSGLAGVATAKALVRRGVRPVIVDTGETLDASRDRLVSELSSTPPAAWTPGTRRTAFANPTVNAKDRFPKKLAFGSSYFYGRSVEGAPAVAEDELAPFSYAKGGLSTGWGSSVLPPAACDLEPWPIPHSDLAPHFTEVLSGLPYAAEADELAEHFPLYAAASGSLRLSSGCAALLADLRRRNGRLGVADVTFGRSRLLVRSGSASEGGCRYCGYCLSGCAYDSIYTAGQDLDDLVGRGAVEYRPGLLVQRVEESGDTVTVTAVDRSESTVRLEFDRLFLGAGAVNSTRIVLTSKGLFDRDVRLLSTVGIIAPLFRLRPLPLDWPRSFTLPGIFLEFKAPDLSSHWIHTQISRPNELVYAKLGLEQDSRGLVAALKRRALRHLVVAMCNLHSDHGAGYVLRVEAEGPGGPPVLRTRREEIEGWDDTLRKVRRPLGRIARSIGCHVVTPLIQDSSRSGGYHVGGTLPMRARPEGDLETDLWGRPAGWRRIHLVDSSTFPSIPGTTIGLLIMANATRIASGIPLDG